MKLCRMIEIYLKYDNMHAIRTIDAFICMNSHINSYINNMLSWARVALPRGLACHVASVRVLRARLALRVLWRIKPPFASLNKEIN